MAYLENLRKRHLFIVRAKLWDRQWRALYLSYVKAWKHKRINSQPSNKNLLLNKTTFLSFSILSTDWIFIQYLKAVDSSSGKKGEPKLQRTTEPTVTKIWKQINQNKLIIWSERNSKLLIKQIKSCSNRNKTDLL